MEESNAWLWYWLHSCCGSGYNRAQRVHHEDKYVLPLFVMTTSVLDNHPISSNNVRPDLTETSPPVQVSILTCQKLIDLFQSVYVCTFNIILCHRKIWSIIIVRPSSFHFDRGSICSPIPIPYYVSCNHVCISLYTIYIYYYYTLINETLMMTKRRSLICQDTGRLSRTTAP